MALVTNSSPNIPHTTSFYNHQFLEGHSFFKARRWEDLRQWAETNHSWGQTNTQYLCLLIKSNVVQENWQNAKELLNRLCELNPSDTNPHFTLASIALKTSQTADAVFHVKKILKHPFSIFNAEIYIKLQMKQGAYSDALKMIDLALKKTNFGKNSPTLKLLQGWKSECTIHAYFQSSGSLDTSLVPSEKIPIEIDFEQLAATTETDKSKELTGLYLISEERWSDVHTWLTSNEKWGAQNRAYHVILAKFYTQSGCWEAAKQYWKGLSAVHTYNSIYTQSAFENAYRANQLDEAQRLILNGGDTLRAAECLYLIAMKKGAYQEALNIATKALENPSFRQYNQTIACFQQMRDEALRKIEQLPQELSRTTDPFLGW